MTPFKKVLVTGASGFIGRVLAQRLAYLGAEVTAFVREPTDDLCVKSVVADVYERAALDPFLDSDTVIFHLAARADWSGSVADPRFDFENNLRSFFEVLESVRRMRCRLIFPSTGSIFGPENIQPLSEFAQIRPSSPYAAAKAAGEAYCTAYFRSYGLDIRIARLFSVYGVGMKRFLIHDMVRKIIQNPKEIILQGNGQQIRDYLYIDDVVEGLILIASKGKGGEDYNLASGIPVKITDLALRIAALMGSPDIRLIPSSSTMPGEVPVWYADIARIRGIGFSPSVTLEEGLPRTVSWLRDHPS